MEELGDFERYSPNMRSIMGFLPVIKEGPKGMSGLKATDFQTIPIAIPIDRNIYIFIYRADRPKLFFSLGEATARAPEVAQKR